MKRWKGSGTTSHQGHAKLRRPIYLVRSKESVKSNRDPGQPGSWKPRKAIISQESVIPKNGSIIYLQTALKTLRLL